MKRIATTLTALLLMAGTATAQDYGQAHTLKIWDNKTAPHGNGIATPEREPEKNRLTDVSEAVLYIFPAAPEKATGQAVVICPGGGYVKLCIDYEGYEMAQWFAEHGITAAVLKYRMPNGHPEVPLEDVEQALRIMMGLEAGATGFTADKVGIVGSSAGGHLAASASTLARTKPAFSILFYPVITAEKGKAHQGSFNALLGDKRNAETDTWYSLQNRVSSETPPTLLLLSD
ncbi:alpha/beta hydrolase, partial [Alistipes finegoldii]